MKHISTFSLLLLSQFGFAQKLKKADKLIVTDIQKHVQSINSESVERKNEYILTSFTSVGIKSHQENSYLQTFTIPEGLKVDPSSYFFVNGTELKLTEEYFPLAYCSNTSFEAFPIIVLKTAGVPWFVDMAEVISSAKGKNSDIHAAIHALAASTQKKGATALILHGNPPVGSKPEFDRWNKVEKSAIPVIFIQETAWKSHFADSTEGYELKLKIEISDSLRNAENIVGIIDNGVDNVVVVDAKSPEGIAAMIEFAKLTQKSPVKNTNYIFAVFTNEIEKGEDYFNSHRPFLNKKCTAVVNMDSIVISSGVTDYPNLLINLKKTAKSLEVAKIDSEQRD